MPKVSVIIPTYNRRDYVQEAIDSVLAQTYRDFEIIVVDDGSTDGTYETLREKYGDQIRYFWQENSGESAARNRCIEAAHGQYIALLDSDDIWLPTKLDKQVTFLEADLSIGAVFCHVLPIDQSGDLLSDTEDNGSSCSDDLSFRQLLFKNNVPGGNSSGVIRRTLINQVGGYDSSIHYGEDWDLWLQITKVSMIACITESLALIRQHQMTQSYYPSSERIPLVLQDHLRLLDKALSDISENEISVDKRKQVYSGEYLLASLGYVFIGETALARAHMLQAHALDPTLLVPHPYFLELTLHFALLASNSPELIHCPLSGDEYINNISQIRSEIVGTSNPISRRLLTQLHLQRFSNAYSSGEKSIALSELLHAFWLEPRYLGQHWLLSSMLSLTLGTRVMNSLRSAKRMFSTT